MGDDIELARMLAEIASRTQEPDTARELMALVDQLFTEAGLVSETTHRKRNNQFDTEPPRWSMRMGVSPLPMPPVGVWAGALGTIRSVAGCLRRIGATSDQRRSRPAARSGLGGVAMDRRHAAVRPAGCDVPE